MKKFLLLAATAAIWTACSDKDACSPKSTTDQINLAPAIATVVPLRAADTRTTITGSTAAWANGDALGLYCTQSTPAATNDQFTVSGLPSTPVWAPSTTLYWTDGVTAHKFLAYAPYASGNTDPTAVNLPALSTQTGTLSPTQDFLISNNLYNTGTTRTATVGLVFTHALALIELDMVLGGGLAAGTTLTSTVIAGAAAEKLYTTDTSSTINLSTGTVTAGAGTNTATITPATSPTLTATALPVYTLILPGTYTGPTVTINIKEGSNSLTTATVALGTTTFAAGKKYTYQVTVSRTIITISNPTITDWTVVNGNPINPGI